MIVGQPVWLLLLVILLIFALMRNKIRRVLPFYFVLIITGFFIIFGLCKVSVFIRQEPREFVILIDNSKSMQLLLNDNFEQIEDAITSEFKNLETQDKVTIITFNKGFEIKSGAKTHSNIADLSKIISDLTWADELGSNLLEGLKITQAIFSKHKPAGLLVITDCGFTNESNAIKDQLILLRNAGINAKLKNLGREIIRNVGFIDISTPQIVNYDDIAVFKAKIKSEFNTKINLKALFQLENQPAYEVRTQLFFLDTPLNKNSFGEYEIEENIVYSAFAWGRVPVQSGVLGCKFTILTDDETADDNSAETKAFISAGKTVLIFTNRGQTDYISEFLRLNFPEINFEVRSPEKGFRNYEDYLGYRAIIFSDVKKNSFVNANEIFSAITKAVEDFGVNFAMTGGRNSFAPGGYHKSEIERILPIELDPNKNKQRAIIITIDRSESMTNPIGASTRIAVVGEAAKKFINTLEEKDFCSFLTFADATDKTGETVALSKLTQEYKQKIADRIDILGKSRTLFGRTNIEGAIREGLEKLKKRNEKVKVILIFSDGEPTVGAKTPEEFADLLEEVADEQIFLGFVVAGEENELFRNLAEKLGDSGSVEFLHKNWDVDAAFRNALLKAGGNIIEKGKFKILNSEKQMLLEYPLLKGYVRSLLKETGNPEALALTDKLDPFIVNWRFNDALTSAILIPFEDFDLIWERQVPLRIAEILKDNFFRLFAGETARFKMDVENLGSKTMVKVSDSQEDIIRELKLKINDEIFDLKPEKPGEYAAIIDISTPSIASIFGEGIQPIPVIIQQPLSDEYQNINQKRRFLTSLFENNFSAQLSESAITEFVTSKKVEGYELTKIFNILALLTLIFWAFLYAFKPRK